jgi:hypothetical protein
MPEHGHAERRRNGRVRTPQAMSRSSGRVVTTYTGVRRDVSTMLVERAERAPNTLRTAPPRRWRRRWERGRPGSLTRPDMGIGRSSQAFRRWRPPPILNLEDVGAARRPVRNPPRDI